MKVTNFVEDLAYRIASFPAEAVALAKKAVQNAEELPNVEGLWEQSLLFARSLQTEPARARMKKFIELGGQTREVELDLREMADALGETGKGA
jgi:enoyl-CoA hydratase/carnithine racemase